MSIELEQQRPNVNFSTELVVFLVEIFSATTAEKYKFVQKNRTLKRFPFKYNFIVALKKSDEQNGSPRNLGINNSELLSNSKENNVEEENEEQQIEEFV